MSYILSYLRDLTVAGATDEPTPPAFLLISIPITWLLSAALGPFPLRTLYMPEVFCEIPTEFKIGLGLITTRFLLWV
jgi:hypothetical protein